MNRPWTFLVLLPRNVCVLVLRVYRAVISPLYGDVCRYYPSCSAYALQAIQRHGVVKGVWLGSRRIARCHPWAAGGVDDVPVTARSGSVTRFGFVVSADSRHGVHSLATQRDMKQHRIQQDHLDQHSLREHSMQHQGKG